MRYRDYDIETYDQGKNHWALEVRQNGRLIGEYLTPGYPSKEAAIEAAKIYCDTYRQTHGRFR